MKIDDDNNNIKAEILKMVELKKAQKDVNTVSKFANMLNDTKENIKELPQQNKLPPEAINIATAKLAADEEAKKEKTKKNIEELNKINARKRLIELGLLKETLKEFNTVNNIIIEENNTILTEEKAYLDKYYTNPEVAKFCISKINTSKYDRIIEPSAGNGSFSKQIPNCEAYDLAPEDKSIKKQDFLKFNTDKGNILVIGNPPFGNSSDLAIKFVNKAAEFAKTIAFILPSTFAKMSVLKKLNPKVHLTRIIPLPHNTFLVDGKPYKVDCHFFIFEVKDKVREFTKATTDDFVFTNKENADFAILRKGYHVGRIFDLKDTHTSDASKYWIKSKIGKNLLKKRLSELHYNLAEYTLGSESISQNEIIETYNKEYK